MSGLFSRASKEKSVFRDERFLYPEFVPEKLPFRDKEIDSLVYCFSPVIKGRKPVNVFLAGPTGVGKTVTAKYVLKELEDSFERAKSLYLNCFEFNSRVAVLSAIANFVGAGVPRRGLATDEVFSKMLEFLRKSSFMPVIILDEVDQLLLSEANSKLLYDLLRVIEYEKQRLGLVLISNDVELFTRLDSRIRSSLAGETILFDSYSPEQLKAIISARVELAFEPGVVDADVVAVAAARAAKMGGDARVALDLILKAGRFAEKRNSASVTLDDLKSVSNESDSVSIVKGVKHLSSEEKSVLKIIAENPGINSGNIYSLSSEKTGLKERRLRKILSDLRGKGFVSAQSFSGGNKGRTNNYSLAFPVDYLLKELE